MSNKTISFCVAMVPFPKGVYHNIVFMKCKQHFENNTACTRSCMLLDSIQSNDNKQCKYVQG